MYASMTCLVAAALFVPIKEPAKAPAELQGTWKLVSVETEGESADLAEPPPRIVVRDDKLLFGGAELATLTADTGATPKVIDLHFESPKRVLEAIFKIDGDTLTICVNKQADGAKERPDAFATKDHATWRLLVFKRDKGDPNEGLRGFVGVQLSFDKERKEISVATTLEGSPAKKAGLRKDDIVLSVGGTGAADLLTTVNAVRQAKPGGKLVFRIRRGGEERDVTIQVAILPFTVLAGLD